MNDSLFVQGIRDRDPAAVEHLSECYLPSVWRFVYFRVDGDRHLAEDIVSEAVIALLRAAASDTEIRSPAAWLRSVANHKIQDHYRAAARVQHLIDQVKQIQPDSDRDDAAAQMEEVERQAMIRDVLNELPERSRIALEWKYIDRVSVREIAIRLDTTEKGAESILFRARREFRNRLQRRSDANGHNDDCETDRQLTAANDTSHASAGKADEGHTSGADAAQTDLTR